MINIENIKNRSALSILEDYQGNNPYIRKLKWESIQRKIKLTANQLTYIVDNHDKDPIKLNKVISISTLLGEELQKQDDVSFIPEKILVEYLLADTEKSFHVIGKLKKNQVDSKMYWLPKTQLFDDLYFDSIDIDVDFKKYIALDSLHRTPFNHQIDGVKFLLTRNGCILADDMGLGKCQAIDSKVLTPNGYVLMGELKVGDYVIGSNGKPTKITGVFPQGEKDFYNILLTDGTVVESCDEHLWAVQTTNHKKRNNGFKVKPLKELMGDLTYGTKGNVKWYLPIVEPIEFTKNNVLIDPYLLGCLLGDGGFSGHSIKLSSIDLDLINQCSIRLPENHSLKKINDGDDYHLINEANHGYNHIIRCLKKYNLMGNKSESKFIPEDYKYNTKEIRLEILQGLLDTDGYCSKHGTIQYYSVSKRLSNDVKELVESFGGVARQTYKIGKYKLPDGTIKECKICFILTINLPENIIPFKLQRKIDNIKTVKKYSPSRGIKYVEFSRKTIGQCISVEAEDHLYLMDHYVVTHNTYQSIVAALESGAKKVLILCPSSVKINWQREINNFVDEVAIVTGKKWNSSKFTIINYDILKNFHGIKEKKSKTDIADDNVTIKINSQLADSNFDLVIIDEAHYLKNPKSIRGKLMIDLCLKHNIEKVWLLSGTPITNRPMDYFNLLKLIKAPMAENWVFYARRYCDGKKFFKTLKNGQRKQIWLTNGASNLTELAMKTRNIILRRKKEQVLDMPEKTRVPVFHELDKAGWVEYGNLWDEYLKLREEQGKTANLQRDLTETILLRKFISKQSIPHTIDLANSAIDQDQKIIIFTTFTDELLELQEYFGKLCVCHYGKMNANQKQYAVDKFQSDPEIKIFIGNVMSAGVGINLTAANIVIFNSFDWVPGNNDQCEDRAYRIGQKNNVTVYFNLFMKTVSTTMWKILYNKRNVISVIMNEQNVPEDIAIGIILKNELDETDNICNS